ncbi:MAG TPA: hypothetical protein ENH62_09780 [Marinobacter sp.]|uniref:Uncharacterized protein n=1 Tax=marine sediment metagenome TaxID=412755 RepID=A0A0F9Q5Y9_9ZZZZ|nr:hypothetical protein [Marinobacter sp.]
MATLTFEQFQALRQRVEVEDGSELANMIGADETDYGDICYAYQISSEAVYFIDILQRGGEDAGWYGVLDECGYYQESEDLAALERIIFDIASRLEGINGMPNDNS